MRSTHVSLRNQIEVYVIVGSIVLGIMFYGYLTGTPLPVILTGFVTGDLTTYNCQVSGHSGCLDNPYSKTCMSGYVDNGAGTCVLIKINANQPQSSVGSGSCPYGTVKNSQGICVSATPSTGSCASGQTYIGGYCVDNGLAKYGEVPVSSSTSTNKCVFTYNLVAMALTSTPTVCNPISGDASKALADFNNGIHACAVGYHWASDLLTGQCVKDNAPSGSSSGGSTAVNTCPTGYYFDQTAQKCLVNPDTNAPIGTGTGSTTDICTATDANGNCISSSPSPFGTGGSSSTGSSSSTDFSGLISALNSYTTALNNKNSQPDALTSFVQNNPLTVMFIVVAIISVIIIPKLLKKNR